MMWFFSRLSVSAATRYDKLMYYPVLPEVFDKSWREQQAGQ